MKKLLSILCIIGLAVALVACGVLAQEHAQDFTILDDITITIGDISLPAHSLRSNFTITERTATSTNARGEERTRHARGVLLEDILQSHGLSQHDFAAINATGADGYFIAIPADILRTRDVLIAYEIDGEITEPRIIIPDARAMFWVRFLRELELVSHGATLEVTREYYFADLLNARIEYAEPFWHEAAETQALPIVALLAALGNPHSDFVIITAEDGLVKTERFSTFAQQLIVFAGTEQAPLFIGSGLPVGMRVHNMASVQIGDVLVVF